MCTPVDLQGVSCFNGACWSLYGSNVNKLGVGGGETGRGAKWLGAVGNLEGRELAVGPSGRLVMVTDGAGRSEASEEVDAPFRCVSSMAPSVCHRPAQRPMCATMWGLENIVNCDPAVGCVAQW